MPNIKSAIKRVAVNGRKTKENRGKITKLNNSVKKMKTDINTNSENLTEKLNATVSIIDNSVSAGILNKNTANRKKSRLAIALNKSLIK